MAIEIREFIGSSLNITESAVKRPVSLNENFNEIGPISKNSIIQTIEGIHVGPTRNFTWYTNEALISSVPSWTKPYQRPLIMHHNERDGKTIGRILSVEHKTQNTRSGTPALEFTCNVPDKDGIEQIKDGRLKTVSIGVIAHDVRCSCCGQQVEIIDDEGNIACGHVRGESYDGEICYWKIYKMEAKELSYVIVPSDIYAHNIKTIDASEYNKSHIKESSEEGDRKKMSKVNLEEGLAAGQVIDEEVVVDAIKAVAASLTEDQQEATDKPEATDGSPELMEEIANLKKELEAKIKEIDALTEEKTVAEEATKRVTQELEKLVLGSKEDKSELETIKAELQEEITLKEAAEAELVKAKVTAREAVESEFNTLRQVLNKEVVVKESLSARTDASLFDAIKDLREELSSGIASLRTIQEASIPLIPSQKIENNKKLSVKEDTAVGNINVEEGMKELFSNMFNPRYNY